ncbi:MAG: sporulation protein YunB [bacterium]
MFKFFKNQKKIKKIKLILIFFVILNILLWSLFIFLIQFEKYIIPTAIQISEKYAVNIINQEINNSVQHTIASMNISSSDFILSNNSGGGNNYIDVNTMLINNLCTNISNSISAKLQTISDTKIEIAVGSILGLNTFSNLGPNLKVGISTIGDSLVDYETSFKAVGINQINLEIYLTIETNLAIVNPLYKESVGISRKLMLVNLVFNGEVPNTYLSKDSFNLN